MIEWPPFFYEDTMETLQEVYQWANLHNFGIDTERMYYEGNVCWLHLRAFAPSGKWLVSHASHNLVLWDSEKEPDLQHIEKKLMGIVVAACPLDDCEVCHDERK